MINTFYDESQCSIDPIEDEIDCAILCPSKFNSMVEEWDHVDPYDDCCQKEDLVVNTKLEYDNVVPEADIVDIDADDQIAAERDIMYNVNDDDELIDIATNYDNGTDLMEG